MIYFFESRIIEKGEKEIFYLLLESTNYSYRQGWTRVKPGSRDSSSPPGMDRDINTWGCFLLPSWEYWQGVRQAKTEMSFSVGDPVSLVVAEQQD